MNKRVKQWLLIVLLVFNILVPVIYSKYTSTLTKTITVNVRKPEYYVEFNQKLPDEYQEVEYIKTSGTQYIDTGIIPTNNTKIEAKFNASAASQLYISRAQDSYTNNYSAYTQSTGGNWRFGNERKSMKISYNTDNITIQDKNGVILNGTLYQYNNTDIPDFTSVTLFLFKSSDNPFKGKLYYLKIWENGILTRSFVPCYRKSDDVIGLYDMVSKTFYTNNGSDTFTKGSDVPNGYHPALSQHFVYGTAQNLTANDYIYNDYAFDHWNTDPDDSGTSYEDKELVNNLSSVDGDVINLYAQVVPAKYKNLSTLKCYATLAPALSEVENGQTIQAIADDIVETEDATLDANKTAIIDLNGKTVTLNNVIITNDGTLDVYSSVDDGILQGSATNVIQNNGTFTANETSEAHTLSIIGTSNSPSQRILRNNTSSSIATLNDNVTMTYNNSEALSTYRYIVINYGTLYIDGATLTNNITSSTRNRGVLNSASTARIIVTSGTINTYGISIHNQNGTGTTIPAVEISGNDTTIFSRGSYGIYHTNATGKILVSGGTIQSSASNAIRNTSSGIVEVAGGTITAGTTGIYNESNGTINISGNTTQITSDTSTCIIGDTGTVTISGGAMTSNSGYGISISSDDNNTGNVTMTDGTINTNEVSVVLNNNSVFTMSGGNIASSQHSAIWTRRGTINITGGTVTGYLTGLYDDTGAGGTINVSGNNTQIVGTINNGIISLDGTVNLTGGTVTGRTYGINMSDDTTLTLGSDDGNVSIVSPEIRSTKTTNSYGISIGTNTVFNFYDGIVISEAGTSINKDNTYITDMPNGYTVIRTMDNGTESAYLKPAYFTVTGNPTNWTNQDVTLTVVPVLNETYQYSFDGGTTWGNSASMTFSSNQDVHIKIREVNNNLLSEEQVVSITKIDKTPPAISFASNTLIVTLDESNPISNLVTASDNESGINNNGLKVYRNVIATGRRTDEITNTTYFTYPGLYAIDVEVSDMAGNTTSINSQILVRWPTAGKYVVAKTTLDGDGIVASGLALSSHNDGLFRDTAETGLDNSVPFSSKYYYSGATVNNYISFAGKTFNILNVAVNDDIKVIGAISSKATDWGAGSTLSQYRMIYNSKLYNNTWRDTWWANKQLYNSNDSQFIQFTDTQWSHIDNATFYAGRFTKSDTPTLADTINKERTAAINLGGDSASFQGYSAFPNVSDFIKACKAMETVYNISTTQSNQSVFRQNSWLATDNELWTMNSKNDTTTDNDFWNLDHGFIGIGTLINQIVSRTFYYNQNYRPVLYLKDNTILSGTGTSTDPFTVQENWTWFDNAQVLQ